MRETEYTNNEDEMEFSNMLLVIWKRKGLVIALSLACAMAGVLVVMLKPDVYRIQTILQPGVIDLRENGRPIYVDKLENLHALISSQTFNEEMSKKLKDMNVPAFFKNLRLKLTPPKAPLTLKMVYDSGDADAGLMLMNQLNQCISDDYEKKVDLHRRRFENDISLKKSSYSELQKKIQQVKSNFSIFRVEKETEIKASESTIVSLKAIVEEKKSRGERLKKNILETRSEIDRMNKDTEALVRTRSESLSGGPGDETTVASMLLADNIQQNYRHISDLRSRNAETMNALSSEEEAIHEKQDMINRLGNSILNVKNKIHFRKEHTDAEIESLKEKMKFLAEEIQLLEFKRDKIETIRILHPPSASSSPIKPGKTIVFGVFLILGLVLAMIFAVFLEYVGKARARIAS